MPHFSLTAKAFLDKISNRYLTTLLGDDERILACHPRYACEGAVSGDGRNGNLIRLFSGGKEIVA